MILVACFFFCEGLAWEVRFFVFFKYLVPGMLVFLLLLLGFVSEGFSLFVFAFLGVLVRFFFRYVFFIVSFSIVSQRFAYLVVVFFAAP